MKSSYSSINKPLLFSWILVIISLSLVLGSGLYSDDLPDFQYFRSSCPMSFSQMITRTNDQIADCLLSGRFTPLAYYTRNIMLWLSPSVLIYKVLTFLINLCAVYTFTRFLRCLSLEAWIPLALLTYCITDQFYINYHDPFTSLHAMYPELAIFVFSAIYLFAGYLNTQKPLLLIASTVLTIAAILQSEIGFIIYPILLLMVMVDARPVLRRISAFLPFAIVIVLYILFFKNLRDHTQHLYPGVTPSLDPGKMWHVFAVQFYSTFPLTGFTHWPGIPRIVLDEFLHVYPLVIIFTAFSYLLYRYSSYTPVQIPTKKRAVFFLIALALMIIPPAMLMMSIKYQTEMYFGMGYLPVYVQDFGFVILMVALLDFIFGKCNVYQQKILATSVLILFVLVADITIIKNSVLIRSMNENRATPAEFYYLSLKNGILKDCEDNAVIVLRTDYFYRNPNAYQIVINAFYRQKMTVIPEEGFHGVDSTEMRSFYVLEHSTEGQFTSLYRILPEGNKLIKRINYPTGKDFSYFDLISRPL